MSETNQTPADEQELKLDVSDETLNVGRETMKGDLRDHMLEIFKHRPKSWQEMTEAQQRDMASQIEDVVGRAIDKAVRTIAADGRPISLGKLEQITVKGGIKAVVTLSGADKRRHEIMDNVGKEVLVIVTGKENYQGQSGPAQVDPDQGDIVDQAAAAADAAEDSYYEE